MSDDREHLLPARPWSKWLKRHGMSIEGTPLTEDSKTVRHLVATVQRHTADWTGITEHDCMIMDEANVNLFVLAPEMAEAILRYEFVEKSPDEVWDQDVMAARSDLIAMGERLRGIQ